MKIIKIPQKAPPFYQVWLKLTNKLVIVGRTRHRHSTRLTHEQLWKPDCLGRSGYKKALVKRLLPLCALEFERILFASSSLPQNPVVTCEFKG